ncbi:MAG: Ribbon-helix-helix protein copG family [Pseudomonadota bacterium]|jgi:RHH-type rel operon transcriptional repressor/antitoxin RelB
MLGLRLDSEMASRLDRFARATRRSRSDIARDAVREYLDRHALDDAFQRQLQRIAMLAGDDIVIVDALADDLLTGEPAYGAETPHR